MIRLVNDLRNYRKWITNPEQITKEIVDFNMFINKIINRHEMASGKTRRLCVKFLQKPSLLKLIQIR